MKPSPRSSVTGTDSGGGGGGVQSRILAGFDIWCGLESIGYTGVQGLKEKLFCRVVIIGRSRGGIRGGVVDLVGLKRFLLEERHCVNKCQQENGIGS